MWSTSETSTTVLPRVKSQSADVERKGIGETGRWCPYSWEWRTDQETGIQGTRLTNWALEKIAAKGGTAEVIPPAKKPVREQDEGASSENDMIRNSVQCSVFSVQIKTLGFC